MKLKAKAAAEYLGISPRYLHQLTKQGRIPHYKISPRCLIYDSNDLEIFLSDCRVE